VVTRRTLLSLPFAALGYSPGRDIREGAITIPSDGDPAQAEMVTRAFLELMDNPIIVPKLKNDPVEGDWHMLIQPKRCVFVARVAGEWVVAREVFA
jgi:hypothetical protein